VYSAVVNNFSVDFGLFYLHILRKFIAWATVGAGCLSLVVPLVPGLHVPKICQM